MQCMHPNGIAYDIIKKKIPVINQEIAKVLANIVEFEVFFETGGNKLDIFIKHPKHDERPIEMASGAEKTMACDGHSVGAFECFFASKVGLVYSR